MSFFKLSKAVVFSFTTLATVYATAASGAVPDRPSQQTEETACGGMMSEGGTMGCCKKMHEQMCRDMMKEHQPCHSDDDQRQEEKQSS